VTTPQWVHKKQSLFFGIGRKVRSLSLRIVSLDMPFPEMTTDLSDPPVTLETLAGVDAAVMDGHPYSLLPPPISLGHGLIRYVAYAETMFLIDLRGTMDDFWQRIPAKPRKNMRAERRKLTDFSQGTLECRAYSTADEVREFHRSAAAISARTYQSRIGVGYAGGAVQEEALMEQARTGQVRGYLLHSGGTPIAFAFCRIQGRTIRYVRAGYDPDYERWSPGSVLWLMMFEQLFAERRFDWADLEFGSWYEYKQRYATHKVPFVQLWFFRATAKNLAIVVAHRANTVLQKAAARLKAWLKERRNSGNS